MRRSVMVRPTIRVIGEPSSARVVVSPLMPGYGHTLGQALRRALLSLDGQAIVAVKLDADGLEEDGMNLILNLRGVRVKAEGMGPWTAEAHVAGAGGVDYLADSIAGDGVEVVNHRARIATGKAAVPNHLDVWVVIDEGRGWRTADRCLLTDGFIPVDARFTPVRRADVTVENTRVGDRVDYDRLTIRVDVDPGTTVTEVVDRAAGELRTMFAAAQLTGDVPRWGADDDEPPPRLGTDGARRIDELDLSARSFNALTRAGILMVGQLTELTRADLMNLRNLGKNSVDEIAARVAELGHHLRGDETC